MLNVKKPDKKPLNDTLLAPKVPGGGATGELTDRELDTISGGGKGGDRVLVRIITIAPFFRR